MENIKNICVFCGSRTGMSSRYCEEARFLGKALAENKIGLVYGGGRTGMMGEIAQSVFSSGGYVTGIIPTFLKTKEQLFTDAQIIIETEDMHERKRLMAEKSDAFIALPGGIGTLEELVEQMTWIHLKRHEKPVILLDIDGFWQPFVALVRHMRDTGFIAPDAGFKTYLAEDVQMAVRILTDTAYQKKVPILI